MPLFLGQSASPHLCTGTYCGMADADHVRKWEAERAGWWDTAIQGCGALKAAVERAFCDEQAVLAGQHAGTLFWDIKKESEKAWALNQRGAEKMDRPLTSHFYWASMERRLVSPADY